MGRPRKNPLYDVEPTGQAIEKMQSSKPPFGGIEVIAQQFGAQLRALGKAGWPPSLVAERIHAANPTMAMDVVLKQIAGLMSATGVDAGEDHTPANDQPDVDHGD